MEPINRLNLLERGSLKTPEWLVTEELALCTVTYLLELTSDPLLYFLGYVSSDWRL